MSTRRLVTGYYVNNSTYVLYNEDGSEFQVIREGEGFTIDNQQKPYYPIKTRKKNGKGTILVCRKFGSNGNVIDEVPLYQAKKGLWALTSGAARNGVFHTYHEPKDELENQIDSMGVSRKVIQRVNSIDIELEVGGQLCSHCTSAWGYRVLSDGIFECLTKPNYVPADHPNIYHRGCMSSTYQIHIYAATYLIYYNISTKINGTRYHHLQKLLITPQANINQVIRDLKYV